VIARSDEARYFLAAAAGIISSSLSYEPRIVHSTIAFSLTFTMPIPLNVGEMVSFILPGFTRVGGSGFFSGGPVLDNYVRF